MRKLSPNLAEWLCRSQLNNDVNLLLSTKCIISKYKKDNNTLSLFIIPRYKIDCDYGGMLGDWKILQTNTKEAQPGDLNGREGGLVTVWCQVQEIIPIL